MRWRLEATFDATDLEADGIGDQLMALLLPLGAEMTLEPEVQDRATELDARAVCAEAL